MSRPELAAGPPLTANAWLRFEFWEPWVRGQHWRSVLEVGPGAGAVGARLASIADSYTAIEVSEQARERAAAAIGPAANIVAGWNEVDPRERFDLIVAFEVLEHIERDDDAVASWVDRLDPEGVVIVSVPAWMHRFSAADAAVGHLRRYSPTELRALLEGAGLVVDEMCFYGFPAGYPLEWARNALARLRPRRPDLAAAERSTTSGLWFQPRNLTGSLIRALMTPTRRLQRVRANRGVGLIARARLAPTDR